MHHLLKITVQVISIATSANIIPFYLAEANARCSNSLGMALVHCWISCFKSEMLADVSLTVWPSGSLTGKKRAAESYGQLPCIETTAEDLQRVMACRVEWKYAEMATMAMEGTWKIHFRRMVLTVNFLLSQQYVFITVHKLHLTLYYLFHFKNRLVYWAHSVQCCIAFVAILSVGSRYSWLMHDMTTKVCWLREMLIYKLASDFNIK